MTTALATTNQNLIDLTLQGIANPNTRRAYTAELRRFLAEVPASLDRHAVLAYRTKMIEEGRSTASINMAISAIRKLALEAHECGILAESAFAGIHRVETMRREPRRMGRWLDRREVEKFLSIQPTTMRGMRDRAAVAIMTLCGLRSGEVVGLKAGQIQSRNSRWIIADLVGKGNKVRSVGMTATCWGVVATWVRAAGLADSDWLFPSIEVPDTVTSRKSDGRSIHRACFRYCKNSGTKFAPHDLRRTFAMLADDSGATVEQISVQLGHSSTATTAIYMRGPKSLKNTAADKIVVAIGTGVI